MNVALEDGNFSFADAFTCGVFQDDYASIRAAIERARQQPIQDFRGAWMIDSSSTICPG